LVYDANLAVTVKSAVTSYTPESPLFLVIQSMGGHCSYVTQRTTLIRHMLGGWVEGLTLLMVVPSIPPALACCFFTKGVYIHNYANKGRVNGEIAGGATSLPKGEC
jgi:hypothetical protein